jgi:hypothetical protein
MKKPRMLWAAAAVVVAATGAWISTERKSDHFAFCTDCGAMEITSSWGVRGSDHVLFHWDRIEATPISRLFDEHKLTAKHSHQWLEPQVVPNPVNEFGAPVTLSLGLVNSPRVISFMSDLSKYGDPDMVKHWQQVIMEPRYSYALDDSLVYVASPVNGFGDKAAFQHWFQEHSATIQTRLAWLTTAD